MSQPHILHSPLFSVHLAYIHLLYFNKVHFQYVTENVTTFVIFGHGIFYVDIIKLIWYDNSGRNKYEHNSGIIKTLY